MPKFANLVVTAEAEDGSVWKLTGQGMCEIEEQPPDDLDIKSFFDTKSFTSPKYQAVFKFVPDEAGKQYEVRKTNE
jgi:hypothetical protein